MPNVAHRPPLSVALSAVPEVSAAVLVGLHEVFSSVGTAWEQYTGRQTHVRSILPRIVASSMEPFRTALNIPVIADNTFEDDYGPDIVIVADLMFEHDQDIRGRWPRLTRWVKEQYERGAIVCSVCSGTFILADAGLLDDREATTHWSAQTLFHEFYPKVNLRAERVLVPAGPEHRIITSGGSASWNDLALYLIARFCGQDEARRIAKLYLFGDRSDGQLPFSTMVRPKQHSDGLVANCQSWIAEHYTLANPVERMANYSGLSSRTFIRRFKKATGYAPLDYVQTLRIEEGKQMLEAGNDAIDNIALNVGYDDPNSFRRLFKRSTGISPSEYRQRFQAVSI